MSPTANAHRRLLRLPLRFRGRPSGAPGLTALAVNSEDGRGQSKRIDGPGDPPSVAQVHPASSLQGGNFAASFGRKPYGAATAAHGTPDRPPAVLAVLALDAPGSRKMSQRPGGTPRIFRAGLSSERRAANPRSAQCSVVQYEHDMATGGRLGGCCRGVSIDSRNRRASPSKSHRVQRLASGSFDRNKTRNAQMVQPQNDSGRRSVSRIAASVAACTIDYGSIWNPTKGDSTPRCRGGRQGSRTYLAASPASHRLVHTFHRCAACTCSREYSVGTGLA